MDKNITDLVCKACTKHGFNELFFMKDLISLEANIHYTQVFSNPNWSLKTSYFYSAMSLLIDKYKTDRFRCATIEYDTLNPNNFGKWK